MKTVSSMIEKMIYFYNGSTHDINHFLKVYTYAKTIGEAEGLNEKEQFILESAAVVHDIACPLCREKYGNTNGKYQEIEGIPLTEEFIKEFEIEKDIKERIIYLVSHHHTIEDIEGMDYQILIESDYIVNADESGYSKENIKNMMDNVFKTETGIRLLKSIYKI
ncbi:MAG: HD domain-containing protein [Lachnospiraceae bacterium]|nr:HD domain-containing protein [Lachnospiraceae bacterium]